MVDNLTQKFVILAEYIILLHMILERCWAKVKQLEEEMNLLYGFPIG